MSPGAVTRNDHCSTTSFRTARKSHRYPAPSRPWRLAAAVPAGFDSAAVSFSSATSSLLFGDHQAVGSIAALLAPERGRVEADGAPLALDDPSWQKDLGFVGQETPLLDDTVRANIALGQEPAEIDPAALAAAVSLAQLDPVLAAEGIGQAVRETRLPAVFKPIRGTGSALTTRIGSAEELRTAWVAASSVLEGLDGDRRAQQRGR